MTTLTPDELDSNDYEFKIKNVDGKYQTRITNKNNGSIITIKTPWVILPFGLSSFQKSKGATENLTDWIVEAKASCYQTLDLKNIKPEYNYEKNKQDIEKLFKFFEELQTKSIDFAHKNSKLLFKKDIKRDIIEEAYVAKFIKKTEKKDNEGNSYPDRITTKIMKDIKTNQPSIVIEDLVGNNISIESWEDVENKLSEVLSKGTPARLIIQLRTYLVNNKFGFTIKLCAVQVDDKKNNSMNNTFSFKDNSSSENNDSVEKKDVKPKNFIQHKNLDEIVDSEDDDAGFVVDEEDA